MDRVIVGFIVLVAAAFIGRRIFASVKSARSAKEGCSDCGCGTSSDAKSDWSKS
ncbi:MAG: FeoB-associated Cys-rich membrane protein [Gemmatimonadaceae bacterium]